MRNLGTNFRPDPEIKFVKRLHLHIEGEPSSGALSERAFGCLDEKAGPSFVKESPTLFHGFGHKCLVALFFTTP
jgi:hypothetical protein